jgi:hypothetical protein
MTGNIIYVLVGILLTVIIYFIFTTCRGKRWHCHEGKCEKVIGGEFSSYDSCLDNCHKKLPEQIIKTKYVPRYIPYVPPRPFGRLPPRPFGRLNHRRKRRRKNYT